jgi:hypothetical protein
MRIYSLAEFCKWTQMPEDIARKLHKCKAPEALETTDGELYYTEEQLIDYTARSERFFLSI